MIKLFINRKELDLILIGQKTIEFRQPSYFNKKLLLKKDNEGKFSLNNSRAEIYLHDNYNAEKSRIVKIVSNKIVPYLFVRDINDEKNNFFARAGENSIGIHIDSVELIKDIDE